MRPKQREDKVYRSRRHKVIAGVCGGIAERMGWSPNLVRLLFVLSCILPGPQFIIYLLMWIFIRKAPVTGSPTAPYYQ
ncbi:PspC domain-containing protein [Spongiactinospora gelatinilytica]|uniref:PspC domain-containing protein n=1 Tax=Spongiactinospora gelatinilytica TaxID=2666298 RepID=UPI001F36EAFD|nr:PspC domain-containing protein [Spongiactinospora gelatinilytica]